MAYHGNPYAQLPHILKVPEQQALEALAAELGFDDMVEAETLLGDIRSRLS